MYLLGQKRAAYRISSAQLSSGDGKSTLLLCRRMILHGQLMAESACIASSHSAASLCCSSRLLRRVPALSVARGCTSYRRISLQAMRQHPATTRLPEKSSGLTSRCFFSALSLVPLVLAARAASTGQWRTQSCWQSRLSCWPAARTAVNCCNAAAAELMNVDQRQLCSGCSATAAERPCSLSVRTR